LTRILAIDTSSAWCSVALSIDNNEPLFRHDPVSAGASQLLLPWIEEMLILADISLHDLDAIAIGVGPGAFTGIRLGLAVAQGLAISSRLPVLPVASLDAIASQLALSPQFRSSHASIFAIAVDARMDEIYWAKYQMSDLGFPTRLGDIQLTKPEKIELSGVQFIAGSAINEYGERLFTSNSSKLSAPFLDKKIGISALGVLDCGKKDLLDGKQIDISDLEPLYIRNKVALTTEERSILYKAEISS
jgi:tRNA threonylcarbamoyladenosine biosynthesis protein TsaB